ncbi:MULTISPECIES: hypothetical protein [Nocardioides]|uniref:Uncharacterized protein n=1 Tax=Nocardioides vastitatis TaxID=2568655 RepID=A0ABW0ZFV1_9ACTN|nr:hypothetical protein [Nocardioides sp.]THI96426.1 hypothetical protein E7Z54_17245 [Nocardioides sp.]
MSVMRTYPSETSGGRTTSPQPRVRDQAREALALMTFSAAVSVGFALLLLLSSGLSGSGH